jgi:hypothetical protein
MIALSVAYIPDPCQLSTPSRHRATIVSKEDCTFVVCTDEAEIENRSGEFMRRAWPQGQSEWGWHYVAVGADRTNRWLGG